jgi:molybdenum-dependent DNA-binding transcriptional regulator ModE
MRKTVLLAVLLLGLVATVAACGGSEDGGSSASVTAEQAAAEIDEIKSLLDQAVTQYREGDKAAADTTVGDAYLEHFEEVEHPLEERDHELMEDLEHRISTEIRDEMKKGTNADEVAALVEETKTDLDTAKAKLQEPESS